MSGGGDEEERAASSASAQMLLVQWRASDLSTFSSGELEDERQTSASSLFSKSFFFFFALKNIFNATKAHLILFVPWVIHKRHLVHKCRIMSLAPI